MYFVDFHLLLDGLLGQLLVFFESVLLLLQLQTQQLHAISHRVNVTLDLLQLVFLVHH